LLHPPSLHDALPICERFTMDPGPTLAVMTTFVTYYHKGLIYRGNRIINWCPRCMTALSDLEVDHEETPGALYYVKYRLTDGDERSEEHTSELQSPDH